jgi:hypothetical protein
LFVLTDFRWFAVVFSDGSTVAEPFFPTKWQRLLFCKTSSVKTTENACYCNDTNSLGQITCTKPGATLLPVVLKRTIEQRMKNSNISKQKNTKFGRKKYYD